mgnify:CR=1 FL=1
MIFLFRSRSLPDFQDHQDRDRAQRCKEKRGFAGTSLVEKLIDHAPEMEIYIIPDSQMGPEVIRKWNRLAQKNAFSFKAAVKSAGILFAATAVGWLFEKLKLTDANIITVLYFRSASDLY